MDEALRTMISNLPANTGRSLDEWIALIASNGLGKHGEIMALLKGEHGVTHGYANLISNQARARAAGPVSGEAQIEAQYANKPALRPIYDALVAACADLDCEVVPKKTAVAFKRTRQFLYVQPSTKTRLDVGIQLKGEPGTERLVVKKGMTSHVVGVTSVGQVDDELLGWIRAAWERC